MKCNIEMVQTLNMIDIEIKLAVRTAYEIVYIFNTSKHASW